MEKFGRNGMGEKRGREGWVEEAGERVVEEPCRKQRKIPALASVIVEALKVDSLQRLCSSLEPLLRRIVSEEVERALTKIGHAQLTARPSPPRIEGPQGRRLQLQFTSRMPPHLFTGGKVEGDQGSAVHVVLLDANTGIVVPSGPESMAKLTVVVLEGDFNEETDEDWPAEHFENYEVKEREGKRPLLTGDLYVTLKEGVGTLGDLIFTDNSSWIRSRKFRLGVKATGGAVEGTRIREAKTEAFAVKDHRGELYKKHYPPALHDEVWRLDRIAKDGALHKKLVGAQILSVEDFLRLLVKDPQKLRSILGSGMSNRMWESTVEHAKTCVLSEKLYVYYSDGARNTGVVFNHIYELRGLITDGQFLSVESLSDSQKISVDLLVKRAYDNWGQVIEYDGQVLLNSMSSSKKTQRSQPTKGYNPPMENLYLPTSDPQNYYVSAPGAQSQTERALATPQIPSAGYHLSGDWPNSGDGRAYDDFISEEIRMKSSEMLEHDDMQNLLRSFGMGVGGGFSSTSEACYSYADPAFESQGACEFGQERSKSNGKAVVGWLKLKAAFRWGVFVRKRAAERRAQLVELD